MTRITIWETPDNREQYRDVPCEYVYSTPTGTRCGLAAVAHPIHGHDWRIYRDAEQPAREDVVCAEPFCRHSTESHDDIGCKKCYDKAIRVNWHHRFTAAPTTAAEPAKGELTLPKTVTEGSGTVDFSPTDAGVERVQAARPRTSRYLVLADDGKLYGYERSDVLRLHIAEHRANGESPRQIFRLITASLVVTYEPIAEEAIA